MHFRRTAIIAAVALLAGCGREQAPSTESAEAVSKPVQRPILLCLGDSLTAGYGVEIDEAWPALLEGKLAAGGRKIEVRNAGLSGSTTKGAAESLDWHLDGIVKVMLLGIGANDGLRGLKLEESEKNIEEIIDRARGKGVRVALLGMKIPPNYGMEYFEKFEGMYPALAKKHSLPLLPFLLEGVGGHPEMNLEDGIHPNPEGHRRIAENVHRFVLKEGLLP